MNLLTGALVTIAVVSISLNIVQAMKISAMNKTRKEARKKLRLEKRENRMFFQSLIKTSCNLNSDLDEIKRKLDELERKHDDLERRVGDLEDANSRMANNTYQLIKEGKIIKSKYNNVVFPYKFTELTQEEIINFFGRLG